MNKKTTESSMKTIDLKKYSKLADTEKRKLVKAEENKKSMLKKIENKKRKIFLSKAKEEALKIFNTIEKQARQAAKRGEKEFVLYRGCGSNRLRNDYHQNECQSCAVLHALQTLLDKNEIEYCVYNKERHSEGEGDTEYYIPPRDSYWSELKVEF